jgi:hypothetical protein
MKHQRQQSWGRFAKPALVGLAVLSLVFLLQITTHGHANNQDDRACLLCQAAHLGVAPAIAAVILTAPLMVLAEVSAPLLLAENEAFFSHGPSRAPPSYPW